MVYLLTTRLVVGFIGAEFRNRSCRASRSYAEAFPAYMAAMQWLESFSFFPARLRLLPCLSNFRMDPKLLLISPSGLERVPENGTAQSPPACFTPMDMSWSRSSSAAQWIRPPTPSTL